MQYLAYSNTRFSRDGQMLEEASQRVSTHSRTTGMTVEDGLILKTHKLMISTSQQQEFLKDLDAGH